MEGVFFDGWAVLGRTAAIGMLAYAILIVLLRASGKRKLSKMNAFDFVVTVALGSTLASLLLNKDVSLAQGALAFALLAAVRAAGMRSLGDAESVVLETDGSFSVVRRT